MRLLYVALDQQVPGTHGGSVHVRAVAEGLAALGHEVHVATQPGGPWPAGAVRWHARGPPVGRQELRWARTTAVTTLARSIGAWNLSWVAMAIPTLVVIAIAGIPSARIRKRVAKLIAVNAGSLPDELRTQLTPRTWTVSLRVRTALWIGLVYEMTAKPTEGVLACSARMLSPVAPPKMKCAGVSKCVP